MGSQLSPFFCILTLAYSEHDSTRAMTPAERVYIRGTRMMDDVMLVTISKRGQEGLNRQLMDKIQYTCSRPLRTCSISLRLVFLAQIRAKSRFPRTNWCEFTPGPGKAQPRVLIAECS